MARTTLQITATRAQARQIEKALRVQAELRDSGALVEVADGIAIALANNDAKVDVRPLPTMQPAPPKG